jgi:hypothetical protein
LQKKKKFGEKPRLDIQEAAQMAKRSVALA